MGGSEMINHATGASKRWLLATASALVFAAAGPAFAADQASVEEVVVTGSRITSTGFTAPSPITTISATPALVRPS